VNDTLTSLNLCNNNFGEGGAQAMVAALRVNNTATSLNLGYNSLGEGGKSGVRQSWGNRGGTLKF
jgi:hypothetical protein